MKKTLALSFLLFLTSIASYTKADVTVSAAALPLTPSARALAAATSAPIKKTSQKSRSHSPGYAVSVSSSAGMDEGWQKARKKAHKEGFYTIENGKVVHHVLAN